MELQLFLAIIQGALTLLVGWLGLKIKQRENRKEEIEKIQEVETQALKQGVQAVLRDRILHAYHHYKYVGKISVSQMENLSNMYNAYHDLGGNGVVTNVYLKAMKLPQDTEGDS